MNDPLDQFKQVQSKKVAFLFLKKYLANGCSVGYAFHESYSQEHYLYDFFLVNDSKLRLRLHMHMHMYVWR